MEEGVLVERTDFHKYSDKENHMESFKNYISEKEKIKNYVIKMDTEENYSLIDSEGEEVKKSDSRKELEKYAKEKGYTVIYFNENKM